MQIYLTSTAEMCYHLQEMANNSAIHYFTPKTALRLGACILLVNILIFKAYNPWGEALEGMAGHEHCI